jgi:hypothetical protein
MPPTQRTTEDANKGVPTTTATPAASGTRTVADGKSAPEQEFQETPNPELQAALTDPAQDPTEQHIAPGDGPSPAEQRSAEAPGIRTEAEVIAAAKADIEAAIEAAGRGHTADPGVSTSAVKMPSVENRDRLVHFKSKSSGVVHSVNEGTPEHGILLGDPDFEESTRAAATAFAKANS